MSSTGVRETDFMKYWGTILQSQPCLIEMSISVLPISLDEVETHKNAFG